MVARQQVEIVTDSTADIPADLAREAGVHVVPLSVRFGDEVYQDGLDLSKEEFYAKLKTAATLPRTSVPPPGTFLKAYQEAAERGRRVLSIHLSSALSGTYNTACLAAAGFAEGQVTVVDSRNGSMAMGWVALMAAEAARTGAPLEQVGALVADLLPRAHLYAVLDTLENLRRGGRIGRAAAFLGTVLNVKPILTIADGVVAPVEKVRLLNRALVRLVEIAQSHGPIERMAVAHTDAPETVQVLRRLVVEAMPGLDVLTYRAGAVVGTLAGPGAVAVVFVAGRRQQR